MERIKGFCILRVAMMSFTTFKLNTSLKLSFKIYCTAAVLMIDDSFVQGKFKHISVI